MGRVSVGGNEEGNGERSNNRRLPKSTASASTSAAAQTPTEREEILEEESEEESDADEQNRQTRDEVQPSEARVDSVPNSPESLSCTLTDPSVLDCPICSQPLSFPVFQCENGHIACRSCKTIMANQCPSCHTVIDTHCRVIEKVLKSLQIKCPNRYYGCTVERQYSKRFDHERTCIYAPCSCPEIDCDYAAVPKYLYQHFALKHLFSSRCSGDFPLGHPRTVWLRPNENHTFIVEKKQNILFILNRSIESVGSFVNVVCVAPATRKRGFVYELIAYGDEDSKLTLETHAECVPNWRPGGPVKVRLLVPRDFENSYGTLTFQLTIRRQPLVRR